MQKNDMVLISLDDHVIEPPNLFDNHLTAEQKKYAPQYVTDENGIDSWIFDKKYTGAMGLNAVVGRPKSEFGMEPMGRGQMRAGCYDLEKRVDDMNVNGVLASMVFPTVLGFDGKMFHRYEDKKQALTLLRAYNDWHVDEWCGGAPGRFIPCALIPTWDMDATVAEVTRLAKKGVHAVTMHDNPHKAVGLPNPQNEYWDPLWKVCADNEVVISMHHGTGNSAPDPGPGAPVDAWISCMMLSISTALSEYLYLPALKEMKTLKFALIESGVGWIPFLLNRLDFILKQHSPWTGSDFGGRTASQTFRDHFYCTFIHEDSGLTKDALEILGDHTICYEMDYPHSDCQWPNGPEELWKFVSHLSPDVIDKVTHLNAMKAYNFDPFTTLGGKENCTVAALRAQATHVDTTEVSLPGAKPYSATGRGGGITTGDVFGMFTAVENKNQERAEEAAAAE